MLRSDIFRSGRWHRTKDSFRTLSVAAENITDASFNVRWRMSAVCQGQVEYGTSTAYGGTTTLEPSYTYSEHLQTVSGLTEGTLYHYRTKSTSIAGVTVYSEDQSATTTGAVPTATRGPRAAPAVPTGANVYTISGSIASDGTGDVGAAISTWLSGLPSGSIAVFTSTDTEGYIHGTDTPVATFRLATTGINVKAGVTLWGYGCKIDDQLAGTTWSHAAFRLYPSGTADIRGFEVAGVNFNAATVTAHDVARQNGHAVALAGSSGAVISANVYDCWFHHIWSDGIFVAGWADTDASPAGFDFGYNRIEDTGRYGIVINQNDSGTAWVHHNIIEDTALNLIGGEDQRLGTDECINVLIEENDLGTFMWHDTSSWLPHGIAFLYDYWPPLPNMADVGPVTIQNNTWTGGCATAMFTRHGSNTNYISQRDVSASYLGTYHDWTVTGNDWTGVPTAQRTVAYWARVHNTSTVTMTGNTNLGTMAGRYSTTGSSGVTVSGNT